MNAVCCFSDSQTLMSLDFYLQFPPPTSCSDYRLMLDNALTSYVAESDILRGADSLGRGQLVLNLSRPLLEEHASLSNDGDEENRADHDSSNDDCLIVAAGLVGNVLGGTIVAIGAEGTHGRIHDCCKV